MQSFCLLLGRICLSLVFILGGVAKFLDYEGTYAYMQMSGMVWIPFFLYSAAIIEVAGGVSILIGFYARLGALLLALFLIPTTVIFHNFWSMAGLEQQDQLIHFFSNTAIFGGLLYIISVGAGTCSLDKDWKLKD